MVIVAEVTAWQSRPLERMYPVVFVDALRVKIRDILIAVTDGLKGTSEALAAVYPQTTVQTCIVHLIRHSLDFTNSKERKALVIARRPIYAARSPATCALCSLGH